MNRFDDEAVHTHICTKNTNESQRSLAGDEANVCVKSHYAEESHPNSSSTPTKYFRSKFYGVIWVFRSPDGRSRPLIPTKTKVTWMTSPLVKILLIQRPTWNGE